MSSSDCAVEGFHNLSQYVEAHYEELGRDIFFFLSPIEERLRSLHDRDEAHGGIDPLAFRYEPDGTLDAEHFDKARRTTNAPRVFPTFVAPEVLNGASNSTTADCYSLGLIIRRILKGTITPQAVGSATQGENRHLARQSAIEAAVNKCLRANPSERFNTVAELANALRNTSVAELTPSPAQAAPAAAENRSAKSRQSRNLQLPNGSVGKQWSYNLREAFPKDAGEITHVDLMSAIPGLEVDASSMSLRGTPTTAGEFEIELVGNVATADESSAVRRIVSLTINPDPMSLWQEKPSNPEGKFAKPDAAKQFLPTSALLVIAASLRGRSHAHEGKYREDDFSLGFMETTGWHLFVVADGAGSAELSRRGSQIACERTRDVLTQRLSVDSDLDGALQKLKPAEAPGDLEKLKKISFNHLVAAAYQAFVTIKREADEQGHPIRDFATTYIVVIAKRAQSGWFFASFSIGDGGAGIFISKDELLPLTTPDSGEFAGQTMFLTMPRIFTKSEHLLARTHVHFCRKFEFVALMTDGITDPIFKNDSNFLSGNAWSSWYEGLRAANDFAAPDPSETLLASLGFFSVGNHDDRTLVLGLPRCEIATEVDTPSAGNEPR